MPTTEDPRIDVAKLHDRLELAEDEAAAGVYQTPPAGDPDDNNGVMWLVQYRWMLTGGVEVTDEVAYVPAELRVGDLQVHAHRAEALFEEMRRNRRCLRIVVNQSRVFIAPPENVVCVFAELVDPAGDVVEHLEPGYIDREGPVPSIFADEDHAGEEPVPNPPDLGETRARDNKALWFPSIADDEGHAAEEPVPNPPDLGELRSSVEALWFDGTAWLCGAGRTLTRTSEDEVAAAKLLNAREIERRHGRKVIRWDEHTDQHGTVWIARFADN